MSEPLFRDLPEEVCCIDTGFMQPGLAASYLIGSTGRYAFVETGTALAVPRLLQALTEKGVAREAVDYVIPTHVHLDHAGGAGALLRELPGARLVVHPRGARHMIDPSKLIAGSRAVYGDERYFEMYGDLEPIDAARVTEVQDGETIEFAGRPLRCFYTEGHARHHYCLHDPQSASVFSGDSFGISYREFDTAAGEFIFPTTTPIHFDPDEAHRAIDRIMGCEPAQVFLTHYSRVGSLPRLAADMHRGIDDHAAIARRHEDDEARTSAIEAALFDYLARRAREHGVEADDTRLHELLDMDVTLNTQGLEHWLDHGPPGSGR